MCRIHRVERSPSHETHDAMQAINQKHVVHTHLMPCQVHPLYCKHVRKAASDYRRLVITAATKPKAKIVYHCSQCGYEHRRWQGRCDGCKEFTTIPREGTVISPSGNGGGAGVSVIQKITEETKKQRRTAQPRISVPTAEVAGALAAAAEQQLSTVQSPDGLDRVAAEDSVIDNVSEASTSGYHAPAIGWIAANTSYDSPRSMRDLKSQKRQKFSKFALTGRTGEEINRVLGGGVVPGALILVGGDPGVGKSTLLLQMGAMIAHPLLDFDNIRELQQERCLGIDASEDPLSITADEGDGTGRDSDEDPAMTSLDQSPEAMDDMEEEEEEEGDVRTVLYISGEEMEEQIFERSDRMGLGDCTRLLVASENKLEEIARLIALMEPSAVVIDSIQTMYLSQLQHSPGSIVQVRECCQLLLRLAKDNGITIFVIGHVTKTGDIAGPRTLEHMVDCVLYLEGEMSQSYRLLRGIKNRHGPTDEIGVFHMDNTGLHAVDNPNTMFLSTRSNANVSSAVAVAMDGTRPLMMEIQALCTPQPPNSQHPPIRMQHGVNKDRFNIMLNVLSKKVKTVKLYNQNVIVNVTAGIKVKDEIGTDLAIAVAVASSYFDTAVPRDIAVVGEVDLGGGLRVVKRMDQRLAEVAKLKFARCILPKMEGVEKLQRDPRLAGLELVPCATLYDALKASLGNVVDKDMQPRRPRKKAQAAPSRANDDDDDGYGGDDDGFMDPGLAEFGVDDLDGYGALQEDLSLAMMARRLK